MYLTQTVYLPHSVTLSKRQSPLDLAQGSTIELKGENKILILSHTNRLNTTLCHSFYKYSLQVSFYDFFYCLEVKANGILSFCLV